MAAKMNFQRFVVASGFLIVAVGNGCQIWAVTYGAQGSYARAENIFGAAFTVGYGLLAWMAWAWLRLLDDHPPTGSGISKVLRLFSLANLAFAIGMLSVTYYWAEEAIDHAYDGRTGVAVPVSGGMQLFGFVLVSAGLWWAGSALRSPSGRDRMLADQPDREVPV